MLDLAPCLQLVDIPPFIWSSLIFQRPGSCRWAFLCTRVRYRLSALHEGTMSAPDRLLTGDWCYEQTPFRKEIESKNLNLLCRQKIILSERHSRNMFLYVSLAAARDDNSYVRWFRFDFLFLDLLETKGRQITDPGWKILHITILGIGDLKMCHHLCSSYKNTLICNMWQ